MKIILIGADILIGLCIIILFIVITINFIEAEGKRKKEKKSIVETGSMTVFFVIFYLIIRFRIGSLEHIRSLNDGTILRNILALIGTGIIIFGTFVNVKGRINLGKNWANQVTIYNTQTLVQNGMYKYIRHPLYASLIWMFYGAILVYPNIIAFLLNTLIFIPFMTYRSKLEEKFLIETFKEYKQYIINVGRFFPKNNHKNNNAK